MKNLQRKIKAGRVNVNDDDPFELFVASTTVRYCYYSETQKILGNTYGMCVLQVSVALAYIHVLRSFRVYFFIFLILI